MIPWYRLDFIPIKRRAKFTKSGKAYTDRKTKAELAKIRQSYSGECFKCPVALHVVAYKQSPKNNNTVIPYTVKPDIDNILKCVMDGLNGAAYSDDRQVTLTVAEKLDRQSNGGEWAMYQVCPVEQFKEEFRPWRG